ncbi:alcohol dehydrogenase [Talaromyces proteolyticus]|uniref:Alcohol dehydrogenase n=1 Tax=Talaromyces proteolyticus TaxID=1131652 RepID=A0AAD4KTT5_9EURO|nr:alcohol dehydrogenase [Talaromyces proteolyticus]KAH8696735.1 alcohol dehydrogenase [Talaromyces proteolyticus]
MATGTPKTQRALIQEVYAQPPVVKKIDIPTATPGSAVVRIIASGIISYMKDVYDGTRQYPYPTPMIPGTSAIGRIAALGADATTLNIGDLVFVDCVIRGRDDPGSIFILGLHEGHTDGSRRLMHGEWRHGTFAEYAKIPIENCDRLDEKVLLGSIADGGLNYLPRQLTEIGHMLVPYGGLRDINLQPGQTVIVAPATGGFGGAAVQVALAMGARVIAMGRDASKLKEVSNKMAPLSHRGMLETLPISGIVESDVKALQKFQPIDAFFDISPGAAINSSHFKAAILSLRHEGRVSLMGGYKDDIPIPHSKIMHANIRLQGTWMCTRDDIKQLIKLIERGVLRLDNSQTKEFTLESWEEAFAFAKTSNIPAVFIP